MPNITVKQIEEAFTEWDKRYRENPEEFESEAVRLLKSDPETYGQACTPYFLNLIKELRAKNNASK